MIRFRNIFYLFLGLCLCVIPSITYASSVTAKVVLLRGSAMVLKAGQKKASPVKQGDRIRQGETLATGQRSFCRLLYTDGTQMNLGPSSRIQVIQNTNKNEAGIIKLIGGKIRTKVTKDLLKRSERDQTKLYIQTKTASMGVRGTDFDVIYNRQNGVTSLVTYEGIVAFARSNVQDYARSQPQAALSQSGVMVVRSGQYSGTVPKRPAASLPVKISPVQFQALRAGSTLAGVRPNETPSPAATKLQNPLPPGVNPKLAQADSLKLKDRINQIVGNDSNRQQSQDSATTENSPPPEGISQGVNVYAPPAGGLVDLKSGLYIPPPPGSPYDSNGDVYIPPPTIGTIDPNTGDYRPPEGVDLDPVQGFVAKTDDGSRAGNLAAGGSDPSLKTTPEFDSPGGDLNGDFYGGDAFVEPPTDLNYDNLDDGVIKPPGGDGYMNPDQTFGDGPVDDPYCPNCDQQNPNQNNIGNENDGPSLNNRLIIRVNTT